MIHIYWLIDNRDDENEMLERKIMPNKWIKQAFSTWFNDASWKA